ncbi:hypothetical protein Emed_007468 [Eimeria media]
MLLQHQDMFPDSLPPGLPARRIIDYRIPTVPDKLPPKRPIYQMDHTMKMAMKDELSKLAAKFYITLTSSPYAAPCMLVPTKADKPGVPAHEQPISNITTIMEQLQGAKYFTIMDMKSGFDQVRVASEHQHKTAFRCYFGHFEFKVIPFGLKGAPGTFQKIMSQIMWEHLGVRCAVYLGLVGYVRMFMRTRSADMAKPLIELTKKGVPFVWENKHIRAILILKERLVNYTLLHLPDPTKPYVLWADVRNLPPAFTRGRSGVNGNCWYTD